jgi:hypothetical protein
MCKTMLRVMHLYMWAHVYALCASCVMCQLYVHVAHAEFTRMTD